MDLSQLYELIEQLKKYRARIDGYYEEHDEEYQTSLELAIAQEKDRLAEELKAKIDASCPELTFLMGELWVRIDTDDWPKFQTADGVAMRVASNIIIIEWEDRT